MIDTVANSGRVNPLGRAGENNYRRLLFDISEYNEAYPDATYTLLNQIPGSDAAYPVGGVEIDGNILYWTIANVDVAKEGQGSCELIVMDGETVAKSVCFLTKTLPALDGSGETPDPWEGIVTELNGIKEETEAAATAAEGYAADARAHSMGVSVSGTVLVFENIEQEGDGA